MEKGSSTVFYQRHINSNIARLDERKDKFIHYRLEFLKEFCEPIQDKINQVRADIDRYKTMRDTQEMVIEQEPDIALIKNQISNYTHTNQYFQQKLDEYEKKSFEYAQYNQQLRKKVGTLRTNYKTAAEEISLRLPFLGKNRTHSLMEFSDNQSNGSKSFVLPSITSQRRTDTESSLSSSKIALHRRRIVDISQKIQKMKSFKSTEEVADKEDQVIKEDPVKQDKDDNVQNIKPLKSIRARMTQFDSNQSLFRDCFEVKKNYVQRSVSQLQSRLISNRQQFLCTCHAIGSKQAKIDFEVFRKLSADEILTLFISFVWLNKKLMGQFVAKRKIIMDFIGKLPKIDHDASF